MTKSDAANSAATLSGAIWVLGKGKGESGKGERGKGKGERENCNT